MSVDIQIINLNERHPLPAYASPGDSGVDGRANIPSDVVIGIGRAILIPLGIKCAIPEGYEIQVRPRSGLALKNGITVLNSPGTVDSGYRNEIGAILINHGNSPFRVEPGMRVCQLVLAKVEKINFIQIDRFNDPTTRGLTGFGDSGLK